MHAINIMYRRGCFEWFHLYKAPNGIFKKSVLLQVRIMVSLWGGDRYGRKHEGDSGTLVMFLDLGDAYPGVFTVESPRSTLIVCIQQRIEPLQLAGISRYFQLRKADCRKWCIIYCHLHTAHNKAILIMYYCVCKYMHA